MEAAVTWRSFSCRACCVVVAICWPCDRGQAYCSEVCVTAGRRASILQAGRRYQAGEAGRANHAKRQQQLLIRRDQSSLGRAAPAARPVAHVTHHPPANAASEADSGGVPDATDLAVLRCVRCGRVLEDPPMGDPDDGCTHRSEPTRPDAGPASPVPGRGDSGDGGVVALQGAAQPAGGGRTGGVPSCAS